MIDELRHWGRMWLAAPGPLKLLAVVVAYAVVRMVVAVALWALAWP